MPSKEWNVYDEANSGYIIVSEIRVKILIVS